jgi:hypothetical protein
VCREVVKRVGRAEVRAENAGTSLVTAGITIE